MTQELINLAVGALSSTLKNSKFTIALNGWPATVSVLGTVTLVCGTVVFVVAVNDRNKKTQYMLVEDLGSLSA